MTAGPIAVCGHAGQPWASAGTIDLSPNLHCGGIHSPLAQTLVSQFLRIPISNTTSGMRPDFFTTKLECFFGAMVDIGHQVAPSLGPARVSALCCCDTGGTSRLPMISFASFSLASRQRRLNRPAASHKKITTAFQQSRKFRFWIVVRTHP
jgi:hypothetical protein